MSTYLHLRCDDHDPPLYSEDVGQHLYDLPDIRRYVRDRTAIVEGVTVHELQPADHFASHAVQFLKSHLRCRVSIEDEYGREHPTTEETT